VPSRRERDGEGQKKRNKNRDPAEPGKGTAMQVPIQSWRCDPTVRGREIAYELSQNKGKQQRPYESPEVEKYQRVPLSKVQRKTVCPLCNAVLRCIDIQAEKKSVQLVPGIFCRNCATVQILQPSATRHYSLSWYTRVSSSRRLTDTHSGFEFVLFAI
jgi:hypothetical protein